MTTKLSPVLYIPHGGGPLPLMGDSHHGKLVSFLEHIPTTFEKPSAILIISAHWESTHATVTIGQNPSLIYDYYGFPEETYQYKYPAPGDPKLAKQVISLLEKNGIETSFNDKRGFDHGMFVPLKLMYPEADIPCIQLSLVKGLNPESHIKIGQALKALRKENVLILGSGMSFHNLPEIMSFSDNPNDKKNTAFDDWLKDTLTNENLNNENLNKEEKQSRLIHWKSAPFAEYCHPREEHLIPLHVCYGAGENSQAKLVFNDLIINKRCSAYLW